MARKKTQIQKLPIEPPLARRPRAVVVGASSGIGAAIARRLAAEGYFVAALARNKTALDKVCDEINKVAKETRALGFVHDVTEIEKIPLAFERVLKDLGGIDALVYVAGVMPKVERTEFNIDKDQAMVDTNLTGAIAWLGAGASLFQRMGSGKLVGISSVAGDRGRVLNPAYNASKAGLDAYLEALRNRLTRYGVQVLTVKPGFVDTEMLKSSKSPKFGVISPERAAAGVWAAMRTRKQLVYLPWYWRWIMFVVKSVPSFIFRRLSF
jgi:short-subunit dehydrogenase